MAPAPLLRGVACAFALSCGMADGRLRPLALTCNDQAARCLSSREVISS